VSSDDPSDIQPAVLTYHQAARYIGVHHNTLRRLVADGSVRHIPIRGGRLVRFRTEDLDDYLDTIARGGMSG
jgi:excisionase family DNA binding protein